MTAEDAVVSERLTRAAENLAVWSRAIPVIEELGRRGIPTIVVKSLPQVEDLYGDTAGRLSGDVDLVVPGVRAAEAMDVVAGLGWELCEQGWWDVLSSHEGREEVAASRTWHFVRMRNGEPSLIDLHSDAMRRSPKPPLDRAIWRHATPVSRDGVEFLLLAPEDRLLFLCWHFFWDSVGGGMPWPWRKLQDVELILRRGEELDWTYLAERARATGVTIFLYLACELAMSRSTAAIVPRWRDHVVPAALRRYAFFRSVLNRDPDRLGNRQRVLLWLLGHDRPLVMLPYWKEIFLPSRSRIAADYLGFWPSWPRYLAMLAEIYVHRVRNRAGR